MSRFQLRIIVVLASGALLLTGCQKTKSLISNITQEDTTKKQENRAETDTSKDTAAAEASRVTRPTPPPNRLPNIKTTFNFQKSGKVWFVNSGRLTEIESEQSYLEGSIGQAFKRAFLFSFKNKAAVVLRNVSAFQKIDQSKSTFYTRYNPSAISIARLTVQPDRRRRYVWLTVRVGSNMGEVSPHEDNVGFDYAKTSKGVYKVVLRDPMPNGEYVVMATSNGGRVFHTYPFNVRAK